MKHPKIIDKTNIEDHPSVKERVENFRNVAKETFNFLYEREISNQINNSQDITNINDSVVKSIGAFLANQAIKECIAGDQLKSYFEIITYMFSSIAIQMKLDKKFLKGYFDIVLSRF